jgi:hypothetical protein
MARKLMNHPLSIEWGCRSVMQNVQSNKPLEQFLMFHFWHRQPQFADRKDNDYELVHKRARR